MVNNIIAFFFNLHIEQFNNCKSSLSDIVRGAFYNEDYSIFKLLNFEDDFVFREPSLFCYFLSDIKKADKISLLQSVYGYIPAANRLQVDSFKADCFGIVNLPNLGYIRASPYGMVPVYTSKLAELIPNRFVKSGKIRLCLHPTDLLAYSGNVIFHEPIEHTLSKNEDALSVATDFFQEYLPNFWNLIESVAREFVVFSSPNHNSFAGIMHHGTAYFNTENKLQTPIFFIDDIAHQCGHIIFNVLTLDTPMYLRVPKDYPLKNYSSNPREMRGAYGGFHGLFTYTCILYALDHFLETLYFTNENFRFEAIGRIGFYLNKFCVDLKLMNNSELLTNEGLDFHRHFQEGFDIMAKKYGQETAKFDYTNQPYTFQYDFFQKLNPLQSHQQIFK